MRTKQKLRREKEIEKLRTKIENQEDRTEFEDAVRTHKKMRKKAKKAKKDKKKKEKELKKKYRDAEDKLPSTTVAPDVEDPNQPVHHDHPDEEPEI